MSARDRIIEVVKLLNNYSSDDELQVFHSDNDRVHCIPSSFIDINDFTLHCIAITAREHGLVIILDEENGLWIGEYEYTRKKLYQDRVRIKKVYQ